MNWRPWLLGVSAVVFSAALVAAAAAAGEGRAYGGGLSGSTTVEIADLLAKPEDYLGKTVRVVGRITDVCPKRGCWIDIASADKHTLRFKVKDDEIVFPLEVKGKQVTAEGVLTRIELDREQAVGWFRHQAEELGQPFDPASIKGPMVLYQLQGSGAFVH